MKTVYEWFVRQQRASGMISQTDIEKEADFLNPGQVKAREEKFEAEREAKRVEFMDDDKHEKYMRENFEAEWRTEHKGVLPAKDRIR